MVEEIHLNISKTETGVKNFFNSCERRKKLVSDTQEHYKNRIKKSKHDLQAAIEEMERRNWDWTIIKSYYSIHHAANALLSKKKGIFSKDHGCLLASLKYYELISERFFEDLVSIAEEFSNTLNLDLTFEMRKIGQYDVDKWEELNEDDAKKVLDTAKSFISYVEKELT